MKLKRFSVAVLLGAALIVIPPAGQVTGAPLASKVLGDYFGGRIPVRVSRDFPNRQEFIAGAKAAGDFLLAYAKANFWSIDSEGAMEIATSPPPGWDPASPIGVPVILPDLQAAAACVTIVVCVIILGVAVWITVKICRWGSRIESNRNYWLTNGEVTKLIVR